MGIQLCLSVTIAALAIPSSGIAGNMDFVPDRKLCALEPILRNEQADTLTLTPEHATFSAIEYYCEFDAFDPGDWRRTLVRTLVGYCNEPGFWTPEMRAFMVVEGEKGVIRVHGPDGVGIPYYQCPE